MKKKNKAMKNNTLNGHSAGITLVELLVSIAIFGIIVLWATADVSQIRQRALIDEGAKNLKDSIHYGQDYARHLSIPSALCAGTPADQCESTDWSKGWTLFRTNPQDPSQELEAIRVFEQHIPGLNFQLIGAVDQTRIILNGEGFVNTKNGMNTLALFCSDSQPYHAIVQISPANIQIDSSSTSTTTSENCRNANS